MTHDDSCNDTLRRFAFSFPKSAIVSAVLRLMGMKRTTSWVAITDQALEVKLGVVRVAVPLLAITSISPATRSAWSGLGVLEEGSRRVMVASTRGIVALGIDTTRAPCPDLLDFPDARVPSELQLSLEDPEAFMRAMSSACRVPITGATSS